MMIIPPRLNHLFHILLCSNEPISVKELGSQLGVSRRTVFRELQNIDVLLKPFNLNIGTINGKGIVLEGSSDGKKQLEYQLNRKGNSEPSGKQERQNRLAIAMLVTELPQKLFYYSNLLHVSESTISNDLDYMESWFNRFDLVLMRKQSYGVSVEGKESSIRRAVVSILSKQKIDNQKWSLIPETKIIETFSHCYPKLKEQCSWMTPESFDSLEIYILVMIQRIIDGYKIEQNNYPIHPRSYEIATLLEKTFDIKIGDNELSAISVELSAYRNNTTIIPQRKINQNTHLLHLSYQLIEAFDPSIASVLKLDEDLLDGLVFHLKSAILRLENHIELHDPLLEQISEGYQDIMVKSANAAKILVKPDEYVPESEISYLAMHFGAAMHRLEERYTHSRNVRIGVVCLNGIGTSYILAAQLKKKFEAYAKIEVSGLESSHELSRYNLVISTVPLTETNVPVIVVPPFLDNDSINNIMDQINNISVSLQYKDDIEKNIDDVSVNIKKLHSITGDIKAILDHFDAIPIESNSTFDELIKLIGYRFGDSEHNGKQIYNGLIQREKLSTQIVKEMNIALLHCRTEGVTSPIFAMMCPQHGKFTDSYFKDIKSCVLMLIPNISSKELLEIMGTISSAMIENEKFLQAIVDNNKELVYLHLEQILKGYLSIYLKMNWKE